LDFLHNEKGIAHNDIKPDNIFVLFNNNNEFLVNFKLADFGYAKNLGFDSHESMF
jgi:serine/threonine protein kinase